jgi:transcriptional regulator with XRE-family HTH domain
MRLRLREAREAAFLSQDELAERSGVAKANISKIERGLQTPRGATIRKLAEALGIPPTELVDRSNPPSESTDTTSY